MKKLIYLLIWMIYPTLMSAQEVGNDLFTVENQSVTISNNNLLISFVAVIPASTHIGTNQMLDIMPVVYSSSSKDNNIVLPSILITGRNRTFTNHLYKRYQYNVHFAGRPHIRIN